MRLCDFFVIGIFARLKNGFDLLSFLYKKCVCGYPQTHCVNFVVCAKFVIRSARFAHCASLPFPLSVPPLPHRVRRISFYVPLFDVAAWSFIINSGGMCLTAYSWRENTFMISYSAARACASILIGTNIVSFFAASTFQCR